MQDHSATDWRRLTKRWLIGIDWCRTEPTALDFLEAIDRSSVKIFDGTRIVGRRNCVPKVPFHPKSFVLRGANATAVISGSGNLSRNGLRYGHELGSILACGSPQSDLDIALNASCIKVCSWFDSSWRLADNLHAIRDRYISRYERAENLKAPVPTEDDAIPSDDPAADRPRRGGITADQIPRMRVCRHFWIRFVKNPNRGQGVPGSQLMMSRMMRVFFGFPAADLPRDSYIGDVNIQFGSFVDAFSLRFSNNAMDVLNLPIPGQDGPPTYDSKTLLFERTVHGNSVRFILKVGGAAEERQWELRSQRLDSSYRMTSRRPWGLY
jgi:hypothetical protein